MALAETAPPLWELGGVAIGLSQQAYPGSDQQVGRALALPCLVSRGDVLRADNDCAGLRALKTPDFERDIGVFALSFPGSRSASMLLSAGAMAWHPRLMIRESFERTASAHQTQRLRVSLSNLMRWEARFHGPNGPWSDPCRVCRPAVQRLSAAHDSFAAFGITSCAQPLRTHLPTWGNSGAPFNDFSRALPPRPAPMSCSALVKATALASASPASRWTSVRPRPP